MFCTIAVADESNMRSSVSGGPQARLYQYQSDAPAQAIQTALVAPHETHDAHSRHFRHAPYSPQGRAVALGSTVTTGKA